MRRIGPIVAGELLDPLHPGGDAGKACFEAIEPQLQRSSFGTLRDPQQEFQARIGDDVGGGDVGPPIQTPLSAYPSSRASPR